MGKIEIEVPDGYEVKVVKKEDEFKDGDVLLVECKTGEKCIFIYKNGDYKTSCYCNILIESYKVDYESSYACLDQKVLEIRRADNYEKNIIIEFLKKDKKASYLKRFFNIDLKPEIKTYLDLIDNRVRIDGYFLENSEIVYDKNILALGKNRDVAISKKVAKSMLAMAMISQLMPYYGGKITEEEWSKGIRLHVITRDYNNRIAAVDAILYNYYFLAFHTIEQRDEFLKNNEQLVKDYLMID